MARWRDELPAHFPPLFMGIDIIYLVKDLSPYHIGIDAALYRQAAATWLGGGDPWSASQFPGSNHFSGLPPTVLLFVPFALLPEALAVAIWLGLSAAAALMTLRHLGLPRSWLWYPPLAIGVMVANPHVVILALLLSGKPLLSALATGLKVYAIVPDLVRGRLRSIAAAMLLFGVTLIIAPSLWARYVANAPEVASRLLTETHGGGFSAYSSPLLLAPMLVLLIVLAGRDRAAAAWLAVPAVWPGTQIYANSFALPLRSPWLSFGLAFPLQLWVPLVIGCYILWLVGIRPARE